MMKALSIMTALCLAGCKATPMPDLYSHSAETAPVWSMVSLEGLDEALKQAYDTQSMTIYAQGSPIDLKLAGIDFEDFVAVMGRLTIHKSDNSVIIGFKSCNSLGAQYKYVGGALKYKDWIGTSMACPMSASMLVDAKFVELAPKIKGYQLSKDGQMLTLMDSNQNALGVFSLQEVAQ